MEQEIALRLQGVSKRYRLGQFGGGTLNGLLQSKLAAALGREDPNQKLGDNRQAGEFFALRDINLTVRKGEALGIIGPNGAGKSTLLKLLSRITAPTEGVIDLYGKVTSMLEVGTGFHGEMTGRENVYLNGAILGMTTREIDETIGDIIAFSEVGLFIDTPVKRYSSGMYVKLAFSVAAHLHSDILIMDEVLAVGDMAFQKKCLDRMARAKQEGRTVLYVSHNMHTIRRLCDRCILLDGGRIRFDGSPEEAIRRYLGTGGAERVRSCESLPREPICRGGARILRTELSATEIREGEKLSLLLTFRAEEQFCDLRFRMILFSGGSPVGMVTAGEPVRVRPGENRVGLTFDLDCLAPGTYSGRAVLYQVNPYGGECIRDVADPAVVFRKTVEAPDDTTQVWKEGVWGHIRFPEGEVGYEA